MVQKLLRPRRVVRTFCARHRRGRRIGGAGAVAVRRLLRSRHWCAPARRFHRAFRCSIRGPRPALRPAPAAPVHDPLPAPQPPPAGLPGSPSSAKSIRSCYPSIDLTPIGWALYLLHNSIFSSRLSFRQQIGNRRAVVERFRRPGRHRFRASTEPRAAQRVAGARPHIAFPAASLLGGFGSLIGRFISLLGRLGNLVGGVLKSQ